MAVDDFVKAAFERFAVERAAEPRRRRHVVARRMLDLLQKPQLLLCERERQFAFSLGWRTSGGPESSVPALRRPTRSASSAIVGDSNRARSGNSMPNASRTRTKS